MGRVRSLANRVIGSAADHLVLATLRRGGSRAIILSEEEYDAFMSTLELEEDPEAQADIRAGLEETRQGLPPTWEELEEELGPLGTPQADKAL